jgi:glycosyltransferase involved in cell wall biosynthesis
MKILFIAPTLPINNSSGGSIRSFQFYEEFKTYADIDVLSANGAGISFPVLQEFKKKNNYVGHICIQWRQHPLEIARSLNKDLNKLIHKNGYDYIFIRYYNTAFWLGAIGLKNLILDCDDCNLELESQNPPAFDGDSINWISRIKKNWRLKNYKKNLRSIKKVIFAKRSSELNIDENHYIFPNKISYIPDEQCIAPILKDYATILFVGVLNYAPNFEGLDYFIDMVWHKIIALRPDSKLKIVGGGLPPQFKEKWTAICGIEVMGYVKSIEEVYKDVDFSIAPVYKGSGTHIKIIESLIRKRPIVISQLAHRGYEETLSDGDSIFLAKDTNDFYEKILHLIDNKDLRRKMGERGRVQVLSHHTINYNTNLLKNLLNDSTQDHEHNTDLVEYSLR